MASLRLTIAWTALLLQACAGAEILVGDAGGDAPTDPDTWIEPDTADTASDPGVPPVWWARTYGTPDDERALSVAALEDGFIVAGEAGPVLGGSSDGWILRLDPSGNPLWQRIYGSERDETLTEIHASAGGGFVAVGRIDEADRWFAWILRLDADGAVAWQKAMQVTRPAFHAAASVWECRDGGFLVAGEFHGCVHVVKLDSSGNLVWYATLGTYGYEWATSVQETGDGGIIVSSEAEGTGPTEHQLLWVLRLDAWGGFVWQKVYESDTPPNHAVSALNSIRETSDGGFVMTGNYMYARGWGGFVAVKLDADGDIVWQRSSTTGSGLAAGLHVEEAPGGFVFSGLAGDEGFAAKLDPSGSFLWERTYGGPGIDTIEEIHPLPDGGLVMAGHTSSFGEGGLDAWVMRTGPSGNLGPTCPATLGATSASAPADVTLAVRESAAIPWEFLLGMPLVPTGDLASTATTTTICAGE